MERRTKKFLFGCLGGCGLVLLVAIGSCVGFAVWINSPGEILEEPERLLGEDTSAFVEWTLRLEDPGTLEFVSNMLERVLEQDASGKSLLPAELQGFLGRQQRRKAEKDIKKLFPLVVAWTARPADEGGEDFHLVSLSARGLSHQGIVLDWFLGYLFRRAKDAEVVIYRDEKIYVLPAERDRPPFALFLVKGITFLTTDEGTARQALDRLSATSEERGRSLDLAQLFDAVPDRPLRGALSNRRGELRRFAEFLGTAPDAGDELWDNLRGVTLSGAFTDEIAFSGSITFFAHDAGWAALNGSRVIETVRPMFEETLFQIATEGVVAGDQIRFDFRVEDLSANLGELLDSQGRD